MNYDAVHFLEDVLYLSSIEEDFLNKQINNLFPLLENSFDKVASFIQKQ